MEIIFYSFLSVLVVSLISFVGVFTLGIGPERLKKIILYILGFSTGALFGDVFIHLLPEMIKESSFTLTTSFCLLSGILVFFVMEKIIHWQHCHMPITKTHVHPFAYTILIGDAFHNIIDGMIIAASFIASIPLGVATTLAVIFHEIPQEIGEFGILIHGGFSVKKALFVNFLSALTAFLGMILALLLNGVISGIHQFFIPFTIGSFIYIAGSDLIPELHKETELKKSALQLIAFILGILVMVILKLVFL
jgi:zinc and cadmium transporter